jgi:hypothetical protein
MNVMIKENQILTIQNFISSNEENFLINQVNDDIAMFYLGIIKYYANNQTIKININTDVEYNVAEDDLFGTKIIQIYTITNTKKLDAILKVPSKKFIFTDYKNYKKFNSKLNFINGYQFENDIAFFIKNELGINNDDLLYYCQNNTALLFSETSKYLINSNQYLSDHSLVDDKNHILDIRKSIFELKKNNFNIKNLYQNIKKEADYKKFSFLTY